MKFTRDNSQSPEWPERTVISVKKIENLMNDREPYAQKFTLSCGHWAINTYGNEFKQLTVNQSLRCRTCFMENKK